MPDLGIGEAAAAFGGGDILGSLGGALGSLFGAGDAAAAPAAAGLGTAEAAGLPATGAIADMAAAGVPGALAPTAATEGGMTLTDLAGASSFVPGVTEGVSAVPGVTGGMINVDNPLLNATGFQTQDLNTGQVVNSGTFQGNSVVPQGASPVGTAGPASGTPTAPAGASPVDLTSSTALPGQSAPTSGVVPTGSGTSFTPGGGVDQAGQALAGKVPGPTAPTPNIFQQFANDPLGSIGKGASSLGEGAMKSITSNPLGILLGAGGLGYNILQGQKQTANMKALEAQAQANAGEGQQLSSYINSGQLPPGLAAEVASSTAAAKATIVSRYASQGMSTDPNQNSALAQELAAVDQQALVSQGQIATQLLTAGQNATNMSDQLYQSLVSIDQTNASNMGKAIANFAASLAGRTQVPGTTISIGSGATG